jgi:hypothetical protein
MKLEDAPIEQVRSFLEKTFGPAGSFLADRQESDMFGYAQLAKFLSNKHNFAKAAAELSDLLRELYTCIQEQNEGVGDTFLEVLRALGKHYGFEPECYTLGGKVKSADFREIQDSSRRQTKGESCKLCHPRARSGYISLKCHSKATGGRTTFEAKMEGSKANSFKSPAGRNISMAVRKLAMNARSRLGDYRKQSTNRQVISSKAGFRAVRNDRFPSTFPPHFAAEIGVCHRAHPRSAAALATEP